MQSINLSHQFLIAMPEMADSVFSGTVTYILQHDAEGAMGVIINSPLALTLSEVCQSADIKNVQLKAGAAPVYQGGPVSSEQGFILHGPSNQKWDSSIGNDFLQITTSKDVLEAIAQGRGPEQFLFCLGYSGWSAGQLEGELKQNAWLTVEANEEIIFSTENEKKYAQALSLLGIDLASLSGHGGLA